MWTCTATHVFCLLCFDLTFDGKRENVYYYFNLTTSPMLREGEKHGEKEHAWVLSHRLRTEETLEERQGRGGLERRHHVAGEANRGEAKVLRRGVAEPVSKLSQAKHMTRERTWVAGRDGVRARRTLSGAPATVYVVT